jgi:predicted NAD/FAD-binding protein
MQDQERKKLTARILELEKARDLVQSERDSARVDKTKLASWLKKHHPHVFREYFVEGLSDGAEVKP